MHTLVKITKINEFISLGMLDLQAFTNEKGIVAKREAETKGVQFLLNELLGRRLFELSYTTEKKPFLVGENIHLSISHSHDKLAILTNSKHSTGVDVELIREKVINIKNKFLSKEELEMAGEDAEMLTALWAAKEAVYKAYGLKMVDFIRHIRVFPFKKEENELTAELSLPDLKQKYLLRKERIENYMLVYIINEI